MLRGIAVLAVVCCHFSKPAASGQIAASLFNWLETYGKYGIYIFFVISGFVIPYSLHSSGYEARDYWRFLYKRVLRLHPPYLVALAFSLLLAGLSYRSRGLLNPESFPSIVKSMFYLHVPADNPVFWTLRIEAEFYIFIGLFFLVIRKFPRTGLLLGTISGLAFSQIQAIAQVVELFQYLVFFLMGTVTYCLYIQKKAIVPEYLLLLALVVFSFCYYEPAASISSSLTVAVILFIKPPVPAIFEFPGEISYSLYLIHFPLGVKLINLLQRHLSPSQNWLAFLLAFAVSILAAWLFWKWFEKPAARWSAGIRYGKTQTTFENYNLNS